MKVKNKIIVFSAVFILFSLLGIIYLNNVFLPKEAKALIVKAIEDSTDKKVTLDSVRINIFKGIVLKDLVISDGQTQIITAKEVSCLFWVWGLMHKEIVIPSLTFKSARVFLERREDSSFNLAEDFIPKPDSSEEVKGAETMPGLIEGVSTKDKPSLKFIFKIYRVNILDSVISFRDSSLKAPFAQDLNNVDVNIYLALPDSIKFKASAQLPDNPKPNIYLNGEYKIVQQELKSNIIANNIRPDKFAAYYQDTGIIFNDGKVDLAGSLTLKGNTIGFDCQAKAIKMNLSNDKIIFKFDSQVNADIKYSLEEKEFKYSGSASFTDTAILGLKPVDSIDISKATVNFNDEGLSSDDILANVWNIPVNAKIKLNNFTDLQLNLDLTLDLDINYAQDLIKEKFNLIFPKEANGKAGLVLNLSTDSLNTKPVKYSGYLDLLNASIKLDKAEDLIQEIKGRLEFTSDGLKATDLNFKYRDTPYKLSLLFNNFQYPDVSLGITSEGLFLKSDFTVDKQKINISDISGKYLNSDFKAAGSFDMLSSNAGITGSCMLNLDDLNTPLAKFKEQMDKIKPSGKAELTFSINGDTRDIKSCEIEARVRSPQLSIYGFNASNALAYYRQQSGVADIQSMSFSFYGGEVNISGRANLDSDNIPYSANLSLQGVKIEELKLDTEAKAKDIAGTINGVLQLNGYSNDFARLSGIGSLDITKGKLWELDLFKGMGKLLFAKDFANIVFHEGFCNFSISDKYIFTNNLMLKSNMATISGKVKLGFDNSIDAALNIDILDELIPLKGTLKDVTTTVIGRAGKFATINITGTLKEPKYKFKPMVENIIRGLADTLKQAIGRKQQ